MKTLKEYIKEAVEHSPQLKPANAFIILKPGFLDHEDEWKEKIESDWKICDWKKLTLSNDQACDIYMPHKDKDFYNDLCKYMCSGDCICATCFKDCEDPIKDMENLKNKIRKLWGKDEMRNAMHSSDSLDNVNRESKIIFP